MCAPVLFNWTDGERVSWQGGGFTRDVSSGGVFVYCDRLPPLKTAVSMEILLPLGEAPRSGLRLRGEGVVIRLEEREDNAGFAAKADFDLDRSKRTEIENLEDARGAEPNRQDAATL